MYIIAHNNTDFFSWRNKIIKLRNLTIYFYILGPNYKRNKDIAFAEYEVLDSTGAAGQQEAITTPIIKTNGPACVQFQTYMYGSDVGSFCKSFYFCQLLPTVIPASRQIKVLDIANIVFWLV